MQIQAHQHLDPAAASALVRLYKNFLDPEQFFPKSLMAQNRVGQLVPFETKAAQKRLNLTVKRIQDAGRAVRLLIPKSRRIGISLDIAGLIFQRTPFFEGQAALILAHEKTAARNLFSYYHRFKQFYKPFEFIALPNTRNEIAGAESGLLEWTNRSRIEIATANNLNFGRSFDFRYLHLSEYSFYSNIRKLMTALIPTVAEDPATMIIKESTCNGYNEFHSEVEAAQEGLSDYEVFFAGCFEDEQNWRSLEADHIDSDRFQDSMTDEEWDLTERYSLVLEQVYWRRKKLEEYLGDVQRFDQEYPHALSVAFLSSGRQRFNPKLFLFMPTQVNSERGELRRDEVGLKSVPVFQEHQFGTLTIFKRPSKLAQYCGGADPAKGIDVNEGEGESDPDWCAAEIAERSLGEQVAELKTRLAPVVFAEYLANLGEWFNWTYWVIEVETNGGNGLSVLTEMIRLGYPEDRLYRGLTFRKGQQKPTNEIGFEIHGANRNMLINRYERALIQRSITLHSSQAISEHHRFVVKPNGRIEAERRHHDDLVFASMYMAWSLENAPDMTPRKSNAPELPAKWGQKPLTEEQKRQILNEARRKNSVEKLRRM
jgi:hypothetical protein